MATEKEEIWCHFPDSLSKVTKARIMEKLKTPPFKSPTQGRSFMRGNQECYCVCETKYLPRNALLIRPHDTKKSEELYNQIVKAWQTKKLKFLSHGTCQQFLNAFEVRKEFKDILQNAALSCMDNVDNSQLKPGDIILTRHGEELVGKPHLILEKK